MYCSISGEVPEDPVISSTGYLFERRLVSDHIARTGVCPVTQEPLQESDLTAVKLNKFARPREVTGTSIPALLSSMQVEWDAVMLELFAVRRELAHVKQEYANALYREDAAKRVIARLLQERDRARRHQVDGEGVQPMEVDEEEQPQQQEADDGLAPGQEEALESAARQLSSARKTRQVSSSLIGHEEVASFREASSVDMHASTSKKTGVTCVQVSPDGRALLSGGVDGHVAIFEKGSERATTLVKVDSKRVSCASFVHGSASFVTGAGNDVSLWSGAEQRFAVSPHSSVVQAVSVHPVLNFAFSVSKDDSWAMIDLDAGRTLYTVAPDDDSSGGLLAGRVHPDGLLFGTCGADGAVRLWDVRTRANVATLKRHDKAATALSFSEVGYIAASGSDDGNVNFLDLRQLKSDPLFHAAAPGKIVELAFDRSGSYLAAASKDVHVYHLDELAVSDIVALKGHSKKVTGVSWGPDARYLASCSLDKTVRFWEKE